MTFEKYAGISGGVLNIDAAERNIVGKARKSVPRWQLTSHTSMSKLRSWRPSSWFRKPTDKFRTWGKKTRADVH